MTLRHLFFAVLAALLLTACGGEEGPAAGAFTHDVASGDVRPDSVVLWTRADREADVKAEVADDQAFSAVVAEATARASAEDDFTAKVVVNGLQPARQYYYRFRSGDLVSDVGAFRTPPAPDRQADFRFVFSGDSDGTRFNGAPSYNSFEVLDQARAEDPDFFLYFGDTIYGDAGVPAKTLDQYRAKYKENREYPALRAILAATSTYNTWDDHEVMNDFDGQTVDPDQMAAGREAFQEYLPMTPLDDLTVMYRTFRWGSAAEFIILDQRTFRSGDAGPACLDEEGDADLLPALGATTAPDSARAVRALAGLPEETAEGCLQAVNDPGRTMLGQGQKDFLKEALRRSDATWKFIVNEVPMAEYLGLPYDRWEGYRAERDEILRFIRDNDIRNVVFLTTDFHANIITDVRVDIFADPEPVAKEVVVGPIATATLRRELESVVGATGVDAFVALLTNILQPDCLELDAYAYGLVEVDADAGTVHVTVKDDAGRDFCEVTLSAR